MIDARSDLARPQPPPAQSEFVTGANSSNREADLTSTRVFVVGWSVGWLVGWLVVGCLVAFRILLEVKVGLNP